MRKSTYKQATSQAFKAAERRLDELAPSLGYKNAAEILQALPDDPGLAQEIAPHLWALPESRAFREVEQERVSAREVAFAAGQDEAARLGRHTRTLTPQEQARLRASIEDAAFSDNPAQSAKYAARQTIASLDAEGIAQAAIEGRITPAELSEIMSEQHGPPVSSDAPAVEPPPADKPLESCSLGELEALMQQGEGR